MDIGSDAFGNLIQLTVGETLVLIDHGDGIGRFRHLLTEHGNDGCVLVQVSIGLVETVKQSALALCGDVNVAQIGLAQEAFQGSLIALHELGNQRLGVFVGIVFRPDMYFFADIEGHQIKRHILVVLAELYGLHGFTHQLGVIKQEPVPHKDGVALQVEVGHQVGIGIDVVLAAAVHLFLIGFHEVKHGGFIGKLGVNGQRLHRHANGMLELRFGAAVVNCVEQ